MTVPASLVRWGTPLLFAALATGCAQFPHRGMGGPGGPPSDAQRGMGPRGSQMMDMQAMCEMHNRNTAGLTPEQRQAWMNDHMRSMPPDMGRQMQSMLQRCR